MIDNHLDFIIGSKLLAENRAERDAHVSSGKLSASILSQPTQWQVLKVIGVPGKDLDEFVVRKFLRGKQIEEWLVGQMPGVVSTQKEANYRDCVGLIDALVDNAEYDEKVGVIPHEVKSVSNAKFKRIESAGEPDISHQLQAGLYALSEGTDKFCVDYVAADDLRVLSFVLNTDSVKGEVDKAIDEFQEALAKGEVPVFVAKEPWQKSSEYNSYPEWQELSPQEMAFKLKAEYPECATKLSNYKKE